MNKDGLVDRESNVLNGKTRIATFLHREPNRGLQNFLLLLDPAQRQAREGGRLGVCYAEGQLTDPRLEELPSFGNDGRYDGLRTERRRDTYTEVRRL